MGKLPKDQEKNMPQLAALNNVQRELNRLREGMCESCKRKLYPPKASSAGDVTQVKCEEEGCGAMVGGQNEDVARMNLKNHMSSKHGK